MLAFLCSLVVAVSTVGQEPPLSSAAAPPANLAHVDGAVELIRDGARNWATTPSMLVDGDIVRTLNGRGEIVFADGTLLHLDADTELEVLAPSRLRLVGGRVLMRVSAAATQPYVIDTPAASVRVEPRGEYGVTAHSRVGKLEVTVARGVAEVDDAGSRAFVRAGEMATIPGAGGRVWLQPFNSARWDAFARWSNDRTNGFSTAASARRLPPELRAYGSTFDSYGRWDYVAPYGNVWFPAVASSWRPYYSGSWTLTRYGWTWIGNDPWAWPTHHFGRWCFNGASWYWIPSNVWGPAWVRWTFTPSYVSWSPIHPNDYPAYWPNYDPWQFWTIMPRRSFGDHRPVRRHAVDPTTLPEPTRRALAPPTPAVGAALGYAVPRETVPNAERPGNVRRQPDPVRMPAPAPRAVGRAEDDPAYSPTYTPPPSYAPPSTSTPPSYTRPSTHIPLPSYARPRLENREPEPPRMAPAHTERAEGAQPRGETRGAEQRAEPSGGESAGQSQGTSGGGAAAAQPRGAVRRPPQ